jgi:hypothetical protein
MWVGRRDRSTTGIPALPAELQPRRGQTELVLDPVGRILVAAMRAGLGRIGTSLLVAPSRWQLEGDSTAYGEYWSRLYLALARGGEAERWDVVSDGPVMEQVASALVLTTDDPAPVVELTAPDGSVDTIGVAQDLADPSRWWGRFWPRLPGWHQATNRGGATYQFDVRAMQLSSTEIIARQAATAQRAALSVVSEPGTSTRVRAPLAPLIPFVLLVLSLAGLWAEGRGLWSRASTHAGV